MAKKLPKYEKTAGFNYEGMAQLTDVVTRQEAATGERINKFLSGVTQDFRQQGIQYATDQAIEDAIRNPITKSQIDVARATGDNPVTKYLQGGTAYNEAMTKMLGQQVAGELNITLAKHNSDLLEQVRLGQIENSETLLFKLSEPIKAQVEFFTDIDPEMAAHFGANATLSAQNTYSSGIKIFDGLKEDKAYADATTTINNGTDEFSTFLSNYPDATPEQILARKETIEKVAIDTSLSMSRKQRELTEQLINKLNEVEDAHVAEDIAIKYKGNEINEVLNELTNDKTNVGEYYNKKNILQKDVFRRQIANALSVQNAGQAAIKEEVRYSIKQAQRQLNAGQTIDPKYSDFINKNIDEDSMAYREWKQIENISDQIPIWNKTNLPVLQSTYNIMNANKVNPNISQSPEEIIIQNSLGAYLDNLQTSLDNDMVSTMARRSSFKLDPIDISNPEEAKEQIEERKRFINKYGPLYGLTKPEYDSKIMTNNEATSFVSQYMESDAPNRVAILNAIDKSFGDNNAQAMLQLTGAGLPITAELSSFIQDERTTLKFMSYDTIEEQEKLKAIAEQNRTSYSAVRKQVNDQLKDLRDVTARNNPFNTGAAVDKLDSITNSLTYHAISIMVAENISMTKAAKKAALVINNNMTFEKDYFIPKRYDGSNVVAEDVINKANIIKRTYLKDFNAVPFPSTTPGVTDEMIVEAMDENLRFNGRWANTADGTGLVYVVEFGEDGSFAPIQDAQGNELTFKFNDTDTDFMPGSNTPMNSHIAPIKIYTSPFLEGFEGQ